MAQHVQGIYITADDGKSGIPAFDDEIFGPVASIIPVNDEAEAIKLANQTPFGLGGAVFTRDVEKGERIAANESAIRQSIFTQRAISEVLGIQKSNLGRKIFGRMVQKNNVFKN